MAIGWWWTGVALGGPLDGPDVSEMGRGRSCLDWPVTTRNNAEVAEDRRVTDEPPGDPVIPGDPDLGVFPDDRALARAAAGKRVEVRSAVASLAVDGAPVVLACQAVAATPQDDFVFGCGDKAIPCDLWARVGDKLRKHETLDQISPRIAPIRTELEALGLIALLDPDVFLPLTDKELKRWRKDAGDYVAVAPEVPWVEIETHEGGFVVRAPRRVACSDTDRDVVRRAWWVARDGRSCQLDEMPVVLAKAVED